MFLNAASSAIVYYWFMWVLYCKVKILWWYESIKEAPCQKATSLHYTASFLVLEGAFYRGKRREKNSSADFSSNLHTICWIHTRVYADPSFLKWSVVVFVERRQYEHTHGGVYKKLFLKKILLVKGRYEGCSIHNHWLIEWLKLEERSSSSNSLPLKSSRKRKGKQLQNENPRT